MDGADENEKQLVHRKPASISDRFKDFTSYLSLGRFRKAAPKPEDDDEAPPEYPEDYPSWDEHIEKASKKKSKFLRMVTVAFLTLSAMALLAVLLWHFVLIALVDRLEPPPNPQNGVQSIVDRLTGTAGVVPTDPLWLSDFTRDVPVVMCHSHNDYERNVPLYDALAAGCAGVEADVNLVDNDLYVDHSIPKAGSNRQLSNLYLDPLMSILANQNANNTDDGRTNNVMTSWKGVFDTAPNQTLILLIDMKTDGMTTFSPLMEKLQPFRDAGYLTGYNTTSNQMTWGPITVVGSGNTPFSLVNVPNPTNKTDFDIRDIFYDAPLLDLTKSDNQYNSTNSYYASVRLSDAVGKVFPTGLSSSQVSKIKEQMQTANDMELLGRYWSTPAWPVGTKISTWKVFVDNGIGILNVDDLTTATRWDWSWCNVMGLTLC